MKRYLMVVMVGLICLFTLISGCAKQPKPQQGTEIDINNLDLAILQATVIDKNTKEPIENAIVYIGYNSPLFWRCHSDESGKCSIKVGSFGDYGIGIFKKEYLRFRNPAHFEKGDNPIVIELEKKSEVPASVSIGGKIIEIVTAKGSRSENHYYKIKDDNGNEEYIFNEIGENNDFDKFVNKRVRIDGFRENGFIGWQGAEVEGIYIEKIEII